MCTYIKLTKNCKNKWLIINKLLSIKEIKHIPNFPLDNS